MSLFAYIDLAAEEAAAALGTAHGDGAEDGLEFARSRHQSEILELAETLNRAAAICRKPGVADLLGERIHSRRLARCVGSFGGAVPAEPTPDMEMEPETEPEPEPEPETLTTLPRRKMNALEQILAWLDENRQGRLSDIWGALPYSHSTINVSLARLTSRGVVVSDNKRPATYRLAEVSGG